MHLVGRNKRPDKLRTQRILPAFFLFSLCALAFNTNVYGQTAAGEANRKQLHEGVAVNAESAPEVMQAADQSILRRYVDKINGSDTLRRKLLISSALFLLLLLMLVFVVARMIRQWRRAKDPKRRLEPPRRDIITVSIGPYTFFFGNPGEETPDTVNNNVGSV